MIFENVHDLTFSGFSLIDTPFATVEAEDSTLGAGTFGEVRQVLSLNRLPTSVPLVIKHLINTVDIQEKAFKTVVSLQKRLREYVTRHYSQTDDFFIHFPGLRAVPLCSFRATLNGETVMAYCCLNLTEVGFVDFEKLLEKDDVGIQLEEQYLAKRPEDRLLIGYRFMAALNFLKQELNFQHADVKAESVWVDLNENVAALIDFDGGVAYSPLILYPTTRGTPDQPWFAPELKDLKREIDKEIKYAVTWESDYWAAAFGLYYLLLLEHPYQFLPEFSPNAYKDYFSRFVWPEGNYLGEEDQIAYQKNFIDNLHPYVAANFRQTFAKGYQKKSHRANFYAWQLAIKQALSESYKPIVSAGFSENTVLAGEPITLNWQATDATHLLIDGNEVPLTGNQPFRFSATRPVLLRARNEFASSECTVSVRVIPKPILKSFTTDAAKVKKGQLMTVHWQVENAGAIQLYEGGQLVKLKAENEYLFDARKTTTFRLVVSSELNLTSVEKTLNVVVIPPVVVQQFEVSPTYLVQTMPVTISWWVQNATSIYLEPQGIELKATGKLQDYPNENPKAYVLVARNDLFEVRKEVLVNVFLVQVPSIKLPTPPRLPPFGGTPNFSRSRQIGPTLTQIQQQVEIEMDALLTLATEVKPVKPSSWYKQFMDRLGL